jgi:hypothetical protein
MRRAMTPADAAVGADTAASDAVALKETSERTAGGVLELVKRLNGRALVRLHEDEGPPWETLPLRGAPAWRGRGGAHERPAREGNTRNLGPRAITAASGSRQG